MRPWNAGATASGCSVVVFHVCRYSTGTSYIVPWVWLAFHLHVRHCDMCLFHSTGTSRTMLCACLHPTDTLGIVLCVCVHPTGTSSTVLCVVLLPICRTDTKVYVAPHYLSHPVTCS